MLTKTQVEKALPANLKSAVTDSLVDTLNNVSTNPVLAEQMRDNFLSYTSVLKEGKYKMQDYLNAIQYVSYKLMNKSNTDAYCLTFPQRHADLVARGATAKDISAYVAMYNKGKLVNAIMEQTIIPSWVLNQDHFQSAINVQVELMHNAQSEKVRSDAANSLLTHLAKPKEAALTLNLGAEESSGMNELKEMLRNIAVRTVDAIDSGTTVKEIAGQRIFNNEVADGTA